MRKATNKLLVLTLALGALSAHAQMGRSVRLDQKPLFKSKFFKNTRFSPAFESRYENLDGIANTGNRMRVNTFAEVDHNFSSTFRFHFEGGGSFATGNSDSLFNNSPVRSENLLLFRRAEFIWSPLDQIDILAGAIKARDFHYWSVFGGSAYLGTKQVYHDKFKNFGWKLWAAQAIPSNRNESNRVDQVNDGTPQLFIENLELEYGDRNYRFYSSFGHFAYNNLPNSVADHSRYIGNSVYVFGGVNNSEYIYSYQGWLQKYGFELEYGNWRVEPMVEMVENTAAPSNNTGITSEIELTRIMGDREITLRVNNFTMGADATVGTYQSSGYFWVNHTGQSAAIKYEDLADQFTFEVGAIQMKEIEENQLTERDEITRVYLRLRKQYDIF